jgi:hypothetical protein
MSCSLSQSTNSCSDREVKEPVTNWLIPSTAPVVENAQQLPAENNGLTSKLQANPQLILRKSPPILERAMLQNQKEILQRSYDLLQLVISINMLNRQNFPSPSCYLGLLTNSEENMNKPKHIQLPAETFRAKNEEILCESDTP